MKKYDFLIVGAGLYGSVFAHQMTLLSKKCLIIDNRKYIGGNCYSEKQNGIEVHTHGAHIFHTNSKEIWEYMNNFSKFRPIIHRVKVNFDGKIYSFPINLSTLYEVYGVSTPEQAATILKKKKRSCNNPKNLRDYVLAQMGDDLFKIFYEGYTTKHWGRPPELLPASIASRFKVRLTYDDNYFYDTYQGLPINGYSEIFLKMLEGVEIKLECNLMENRDLEDIADRVIFTGRIDEYYDYCFGRLEYRSLRFDTKILQGDYQGVSVMNYTSLNTPFTRIIEHKHFGLTKHKHTVVSWEYPEAYNGINEPYYPINDDLNNTKYEQYKSIKNNKVIFGGRLGAYKYYNMDQVISQAFSLVRQLS